MKRIFSVFAVLLLCLSFAGCNRAARSTGERSSFVSPDPDYAQHDLGEQMTINIFFFSNTDAPDLPEILELANSRYFRPTINAQIDLVLVPTANRATLYPLILAGGEDVDLIFTAPWHLYDEEASKGSFVELTDDFRNRYMPKSQRSQLAISWEQARTQGKIYGVPSSRTGYDYKYAVIREDLKEKYNLPFIDSWSTLERYAFTVSRNEQGVPAYNTAATTWELMNVYMESRNILLTTQPVYFAWYNRGVDPEPQELHFMYTSEWYSDYIREMRRWMDAGCWSRNVMNNNVPVRDAFVQGRSGAVFWNASVFNIGTTMEENGHGKAGWYDAAPNALVRRMSFNNNMFAVASNSDRPGRSAMVLDLIKNDVELNRLLRNGIEGRHHIRPTPTTYVLGPESTRYPNGFWTWAFEFPGDLSQAWTDTTPPRQIELQGILDARITDITMDGFRVNLADFQTEWAVINALIEEYRPSFECGVFGAQTEDKITEFQNRLRVAGIDKVTQSVRSQYTDYMRRMRGR